jgi:hypothetical protein
VFGDEGEEEVTQKGSTSAPATEYHVSVPKITPVIATGRRLALAKTLAPAISRYISDISNPEFQRYRRNAGSICKLARIYWLDHDIYVWYFFTQVLLQTMRFVI